MRFAFILDPLPLLKAYKDSSIAMMRAAQVKGHHCFAIMPESLRVEGDASDVQVFAEAVPLTLSDDNHDWYQAGEAQDINLKDVDAVIMRKDPPFDGEYLYATHLLEVAERSGAKVFNSPKSLRNFNEKLSILRFNAFISPTLVTKSSDKIREFVAKHHDVILKPLDGMGGMGIFRVTPSDPNLSVILESMTLNGAVTIMAQRYIPEIVKGDKRILLINGEPMPYALARIPQVGETRGNLAAGGRGVAQPLSERDEEIARAVGPLVKAEGLLLVGLDVIGDYLTEVNVTSPTCMVEIANQTDCRPAELFIDALVAAVS